MAGNFNLPTENIDEVILRLLALEPNEIEELDYETYKSNLRELLAEITTGSRKIDGSEVEGIKAEFKRVRGKKGRFKIKKTKISATGLGLGGIRKQVRGTQKRLMLAPSGGVGAGQKDKIDAISQDKVGEENPLLTISKTLDSILNTLIGINKQNQKENEKRRRGDEQKKRAERETGLESKTFDGLKKAVAAVTKPFQSIFDKIMNFIFFTLLGRVVVKLFDWFSNKENQKKIQSLIRFFKDHWPTILALYLRFGTGLGRFVGGLSRLLIKGSLKLIQITASIAAKMGLKKAGKLASFLGGRGGRLLGAGLAVGADVAITAGASGTIEGLAGGDFKVPGFFGGGWAGGIKNFFGNMFSGLVKGPKGRDKVPAMLTDGEFVMSKGAVQKYGIDTLESMNAAGGGTNIPQITDGVTYAQGGGYIGSQEEKKEKIKDPILEKRERLAKSQLQAQKALSSGSGLSLKGESTGRDLGTGYGAKNQGRDAVVVKGGAEKMDLSITLGGKRYYGMRRGNDAVYVALDRRDRAVPSGGLFQPGGLFGGPRMSARMDYAASKNRYYSSSDQKTYRNYNDAEAARKSRMTSLASQQRLDKLSYAGARGGSRTQSTSRGVRFDAEDKVRREDFEKRGGLLGQIGRSLTSMFGSQKDIDKNKAADAAATFKMKQAGAASIGRYFSSSDGKYYKDYNAAKLAHEQRKKSGVKPLPKPKPKYNPAGGGMGGMRGSGSSSSKSQTAPSPSPRHKAGTRLAQTASGTKR